MDTVSTLPTFLSMFGNIVSAVLQAILTPIMELVGFVLRTIIGPILEVVLPPVIQFALDLIMSVLSSVFYTLLKSLLQILEVIEGCFKIFSGIGTVTYNGTQTDLLRLFVLENNDISRAFWILTILCFALCIVFALYATARSTLDFDFENKRSIGKIFGALGKAGITFLLIPFFAMFAIRLTSVVMVQVYNVTQTESLSVADTVFQISAMHANKDAAHNLSPTQTFTQGMRAGYSNGRWKDTDYVKRNFDLAKFDYVLGLGLAVFLILIFATIAFTFVQRLYEIMLLYIAAPFFVASMPLDDGQKYGAWRDMFIAKLVSGMGTVVMMNIFLMVVPIIMDDSLRLDPRAEALDPSNLAYNYLLKVVFVVGGALAVKQSGSLITSLVHYQAGMQESQTIQQTGTTMNRAALFAGAGAFAVGKGVMAPVKFGGKMAYRGIQYGLTKKMLGNDGSGKAPPEEGGSASANGVLEQSGGAFAGGNAPGGETSALRSDTIGGNTTTAIGSTGEQPSRVTKFLRGTYTAGVVAAAKWTSVKDGATRVGAFAKGDFAGAFMKHGQPTYRSQRIDAFLKGNMTDFIKMGNAGNKQALKAADAREDTARKAAVYQAGRPWEQNSITTANNASSWQRRIHTLYEERGGRPHTNSANLNESRLLDDGGSES